MRIYTEQTLNVLVIEGVSQGPCVDFLFTADGDNIDAFRIGAQVYDIKGFSYLKVQNEIGVYFTDMPTCLSYLRSLTIPHFPLRFTTTYPLTITGDDVELDQTFINQNLYLIDGGNC